MKFRHITLMLAALLMWGGCGQNSDDEQGGGPTPQPNEKAIAFSGNLSEKNVTRAGEVGLENYYKRFKVWAFKDIGTVVNIVMDGYTVKWISNSANTTASNSSNWEYVNQQDLGKMEQSIKYWDYSASAYRFFGVAGASETNVVSGKYMPDATTPTSYVVTYTADAYYEENTPYYSHLWYSEGAGYGKPVQLEFIKPLSKVRFVFTFEDPSQAEETELTGKSFRPSDGGTIKMRGLVSVTYPLSGTASAETFAADAEAEGITGFTQDYYDSVTKDEEEDKVVSPYLNADGTPSVLSKIYTVLPTPSGQSAYAMTVSVNGEPKTTTVPADYMTWLPGYLYTYIFKIHVDGSVTIDNVQSAFTPWIEYEKDDHRVHNW